MATKPAKHYQKWSTGLCGCFDDVGTCCFGLFCQSCLFGQNAAKIEGRNSCCVNCFLYFFLHMFGCCACFAKQKRKDLRAKYDLPHGECCGDFCVHCFLGPCAVCQEARELDNRSKMAPAQFVTQAPPMQVMV